MKLLAFDTSTETMSLAVQHGDVQLLHTAPGGAQASTQLIPAIEALMQQAGLSYAQLDAIVFGRGPGSFTGLRTACSVAQGLAFGAGLKVLPVDTLLALAQEARLLAPQASHVLAALDARMGEVYSSHYEFDSCPRAFHEGYSLKRPEEMQLPQAWGDVQQGAVSAGNIRPTLDAQLPDAIRALPFVPCLPTARALLQLAPGLIAAGGCVDPEQALPLYIRDKVALTTAEREAKPA